MSDLLNQASLVMVPSGYKEDTVYSVVPSDGSGDLSFTRASNGTRINSQGLVENMPWNLVQQSETFNNGYWEKGGASITENATTAPNGTTTADKFIESATLDTHQIYLNFVGNTGVATLFIYAKKAERSAIQITTDQSTDPAAIFNIDTGVIYSSANCTPFIESVGGGWYKCGITYTIDQTSSYPVFRIVDSSFNVVYTGNGTSGIYIYGAQINIGSTVKPYFPTTDRLNVPRLTYQNGGGGCPSLLLEKQSTNLALQSQSFASPWSIGNYLGTNPVITVNYGISPDGTQNATRIQLARTNTNDSYSQIYQYPISVTNGQQYTWSVWLKALSGTPTISIIGDFGRPSVTLTSEWVRYTGTATANASQTQLEIAILGSNYASGNSLTADFLAWGYQFEQSSYPTSYIPTTSSSATRVADAFALKDITSFSIGNAYTILLDVTMQSSDNNKLFFETRTSTNATSLTARNFNGALRLFNNIDASYPLAAVSSSTNKWVVRINGTSYDLFAVSGGIATKDSATITTARNFGYFELAGSTTQLYFDELVIFPTALTDAECQSLVL